jgi:hypothetical protein
MTETYLSFADLDERGIVHNRTQLANLIKKQGFPPGILLSRRTRRWPWSEIQAWIEARRAAQPQSVAA